MSARDANNRLSRRIREAQPVQDRLAPFRPAAHSELPPPPPPPWLREPAKVCDNWPECQCTGDCDDTLRGLTEVQCILLIVLFAIGVSGLGLIYLAVR